jgi:hypothetical protein
MREGGPIEDLFEKLDDLRFNLIVIGQPVATDFRAAPMVSTHVIPAIASNGAALAQKHLAGPAFYLVRPDGHIGIAGGRLDTAAVANYLQSNGLRLAPTGR